MFAGLLWIWVLTAQSWKSQIRRSCQCAYLPKVLKALPYVLWTGQRLGWVWANFPFAPMCNSFGSNTETNTTFQCNCTVTPLWLAFVHGSKYQEESKIHIYSNHQGKKLSRKKNQKTEQLKCFKHSYWDPSNTLPKPIHSWLRYICVRI